MLWSFCVLLGCLIAGATLREMLGLPIPGTVIGLALLLALLCTFGRRDKPNLLPAADALLPYLGLFFVPPGVAAVLQLRHNSHAYLPVAAGILVSSVLTLAVTGLTAQGLLAWQARCAAAGARVVTSNVATGGLL